MLDIVVKLGYIVVLSESTFMKSNLRGDYVTVNVEVGDMFRSKITGDMFYITLVDSFNVIIELMYSETSKRKLLSKEKLIENHIKYD